MIALIVANTAKTSTTVAAAAALEHEVWQWQHYQPLSLSLS